jgi:hypothetical protein
MTERGETVLECPDGGRIYLQPRIYRLPEEDVGALENRVWLDECEYQIVDRVEPPPKEHAERKWKARAPLRRDELGELLEDLSCRADVVLPPDLLARLKELIFWVADRPWSHEEIRYWRWYFVHASIKAGKKRKQAYADAKVYLEDTPADCGIEMIKKDYDAVKRARDAAERECPF